MNFLSFLLYQYTALSSAWWMAINSGGSVIGKASTVDPDISPTPLVLFTGVKKCEIWHCFQHHSTLSCPRLKMQQGIQTLTQTCIAMMIALCLHQVW